MNDDNKEFWVFAYGSLMWRPEFDYAERTSACLFGWRRSLCIYSAHYRGTAEQPGLVLGLDQGGSCHGVAFRIESSAAKKTREKLDEREMLGNVYTLRVAHIHLHDKRRVPALFYSARRESPFYAGALEDEEIIRVVRKAYGERGSSRDYLAETVAHLNSIGIEDRALSRILRLVDQG